jgi:hypothetical protein
VIANIDVALTAFDRMSGGIAWFAEHVEPSVSAGGIWIRG